MASLSVILITLNEENNLSRCLKSVEWADEIVIVDCGSTDRSSEIAKEYGARFIHHDWEGYGRQKSYLDRYGDSEYSLAFLPKVEITLWVDDSRAEEIYKKIVEVARTGRMGDGKIFVVGTPEHVIDF